MVTLYDLGITINFIICNSKQKLINIAETPKEINDVNLTKISFAEYQSVDLEFYSASSTDRLYFDGIDLLPAEMCEVDEEGDCYLKPQEEGKIYPIFEYTENSEYYPMRVGTFEIRIWHNHQIYFQYFTVTPKNVSSSEWSIMQRELEEEIQGLSSDIIRKNLAVGDSENGIWPSEELYKFFVLKKHFSNILAAFIDLKDRPNYRIEKEYKLESLCHAAYIDNVTIKDYLKRGGGEEKYFVPKRIYNYDLPENRWLKKIITIYEKELRRFEEATVRYIYYLKLELQELNRYVNRNIAMIRAKEKVLFELQQYLDTAKDILHISELIKTQEWYRQIRTVDSFAIPHTLIYDVRYNAFYKLYKELLKSDMQIQWNESYSYAWKLSDKMYEIWCFIKICRFLLSDELGFEASGWIFDEYKKEHILVPELLPGTKLEFKKEHFAVKLYYNKTLPKKINDTNKENAPVFLKEREIRAHSKPDIRMDLYQDNNYWSSLIFEVKYRQKNSFWSSKNNSCKEQIRCYKNDIASKFCEGLSADSSLNRRQAVVRVWVLNPTHLSKDVIDKQNEGIKFVQLRPGMDFCRIIEELKKEINQAFYGEFNK